MAKKNQREKEIGFDVASPVYLLAVLIFLTGFLLLGWYLFKYYRGNLPRVVQQYFPGEEIKAEEKCPERRLLDGVCVGKGESAPRLVGVMVENSADAWPLSGLSEASVVYEAPVEGNIPRFLAIYPATTNVNVEKVGPVRSARPYYLDWAEEYGSMMYMHVGGSPAALERIQGDHSFIDMNEFYRGQYFWRSSDRSAPHNAYTSSDLWNKAFERYASTNENEITGWKFAPGNECEADCVLRVEVNYHGPTYNTSWEYSTSTGRYERWQNRTPDYDGKENRVVADTVIVMRVEAEVLDEIGRKEIETIGTGEALVFRNGSLIRGRWKKDSSGVRTRWLTESGEEISLDPGKIWIQVVPTANSVEWK